MTDTSQKYGSSFISTVTIAKDIFQKEGIYGLFSGVVPRVVYIGPSCAVFFVVYEGVKSLLLQWR